MNTSKLSTQFKEVAFVVNDQHNKKNHNLQLEDQKLYCKP